MKVLFLTSFLTRSAGGLYFSVSGLAKALLDQGADIAVMGQADRFFDEDRAIWGNVPLIARPSKGSYGLDPRVPGQIRAWRPDLVHVHGIWSALSIYGRAAAAANIPVVVSPRGMVEPWILARRPLVKAAHAALFERPLLRRAHIHALNEAEREAASAYIAGSDARTFVVPNGIPETPPAPHAGSKRGTLFVGRLHSKKQVVELIRAWRALSLPDEETLTIGGWGDPEYETAVRQAAEGAANVTIAGSLYGEAKATALSGARFFILPSLSEGLPMAVLEAIQHGCIPIITPECRLPELLRDGIALRMESDFSDFPAVMQQALSFPDAEAMRRSAAASAYAANYAWPRIARAMITHYTECLTGTRD